MLSSTVASANLTHLSCENPQKTFEMIIAFDQDLQHVTMNGAEITKNVSIDSNHITFDFTMNGVWNSYLSRNTGILRVYKENTEELVGLYRCTKANPKF